MKKLLLLLLLLLLVGCAPPLEKGTIIEKTIVPAHSYQQWYTIGKIRTFRTVHIPTRYWVKIEGTIRQPMKRLTEEHHFEESFYNSLKIGDVLIREGEEWKKQ